MTLTAYLVTRAIFVSCGELRGGNSVLSEQNTQRAKPFSWYYQCATTITVETWKRKEFIALSQEGNVAKSLPLEL